MRKEKRLAREIRLLGLTQAEFGEKIGVSRQQVSNWCCGHTISPKNVKKLYKAGISKKAVADPAGEFST